MKFDKGAPIGLFQFCIQTDLTELAYVKTHQSWLNALEVESKFEEWMEEYEKFYFSRHDQVCVTLMMESYTEAGNSLLGLKKSLIQFC